MGDLPNVGPVVIGSVNFLVPAAGGDEGDFAPGESFLAGERFDDVVGKLVRIGARRAVVDFGKDRARRCDPRPRPSGCRRGLAAHGVRQRSRSRD